MRRREHESVLRNRVNTRNKVWNKDTVRERTRVVRVKLRVRLSAVLRGGGH